MITPGTPFEPFHDVLIDPERLKARVARQDGIDTVATWRPGDQNVRIRNTNSGGAAEIGVKFGSLVRKADDAMPEGVVSDLDLIAFEGE